MKDRIRKIMEGQHMSQKVFAQFTGISEGSLSGVFNGRTRPTLQMVESIHAKLPNVSVNWLMFGTGPMYLDEVNSSGTSEDDQTSEVSPLLNVQPGGLSSQPDGLAPSLFEVQDVPTKKGDGNTPNNIQKTVVKYIDKPERHITEIRIFFDDQTWETFEPKR
ncbi:MAG: helix-turn-helix transcriptional regulator [Prevotella sp.]|nr:helix-turn-helix transcriptional regulator [Prevotella sp.]